VADTLPGLGVGSDDDEPEAEGSEVGGGRPDLEEEPQSGLGRGLAAIIPTLADLDTPPPSGRRRRRRGGVAALLGTPAEAAAPTVVGTETPAPIEATPAVAAAPPPVDPEPSVDTVPERLDDTERHPEPVHIPAPSAVRKLRDDLVGALLDGLANTMALDLCGYLHQEPGEEPHLFLQSPALDAIGPARAYALFDALRVDLAAGRSDPEFAAAGFRGVAVATVGDGSRGLWAVARADDITTPEREVATRFCRSFGRAVHQLDGAAAPANTIARPLHVEVHRSRDSVLAEVQVRIGDQILPGHGRAATRVEAITRAVLVAAGHHVTFRYASEVAHEGEHAAVVLLEGGDHAVALGSALSPESGGVATAQAALRALDGLTPEGVGQP